MSGYIIVRNKSENVLLGSIYDTIIYIQNSAKSFVKAHFVHEFPRDPTLSPMQQKLKKA